MRLYLGCGRVSTRATDAPETDSVVPDQEGNHMAYWMLYCASVSLLLAVAVSTSVRFLLHRRKPLRWLWALALGLSCTSSVVPYVVAFRQVREH